jgi:uncharacterized RDD family membrane protein YckC
VTGALRADGRGGAASAARREIVTPEGIPLALTLAEPGDRLGAFLFDALIILVASFGLLLAAAAPVGAPLDATWATPFVIVASFLLRNFYFMFFELRWQGATPGKRILGIRVIDRRGGALSADAVVARNLVRDLEVFLPVTVLVAPEQVATAFGGWTTLASSAWLLVFAAMPLCNRDRLRVGDMVAGTLVVLRPRAVLLPDLGAARRADRAREFTAEQLDCYGIYELQVLEELLRGSHGLDHGRALETVAGRIQAKIGWGPGRGPVDAERFCGEFYAALRAHLERKLLLGQRRRDKHAPR